MTKKTIPHPRGKNLSYDATWQTRVGTVVTPINLTGKTMEVFEVQPASLAGMVTASLTNALSGKFHIDCAWDSTKWPDGVGPLVQFRVRTTDKSLAGQLHVVELI